MDHLPCTMYRICTIPPLPTPLPTNRRGPPKSSRHAILAWLHTTGNNKSKPNHNMMPGLASMGSSMATPFYALDLRNHGGSEHVRALITVGDAVMPSGIPLSLPPPPPVRRLCVPLTLPSPASVLAAAGCRSVLT